MTLHFWGSETLQSTAIAFRLGAWENFRETEIRWHSHYDAGDNAENLGHLSDGNEVVDHDSKTELEGYFMNKDSD